MPHVSHAVVFKGSHSLVDLIDKQRLVFLESTLQILVNEVVAVEYGVDTTDTVSVTPSVTTVFFRDFTEGRALVNLWLDFVRKERTNGLNPAEAVGIRTEHVVGIDKINFEMKRGATTLTEGEADLTTKILTFDFTPALTMTFSEFLLYNRLFDTVAASIKKLT